MKKSTILLQPAYTLSILLLSMVTFCFTANAQIEWQNSLGGSDEEMAQSMHQTTDGGYVLAGYSFSNDGDVIGNHGSRDYWIVKLNSSGNLQWQNSLGGSEDDVAFSIQQTTDGGYVVAGFSNSSDGDVSGNQGSYDCWIVKLDSAGNLQWQNSLGGSEDDWALSIQQTTDGGYVVAGHSESNDGDITGNHGSADYWIVKLDGSGNLQWQKNLGGSSLDAAHSIQQTTDGGCVVAGFSYSDDGDVGGNQGSDDVWIVKLDDSGILQWQKSLGGSDWDRAHSIQQTTDGGYVVAGRSLSSDGDVSENQGSADFWILKLDGSGDLQWQKSLGGSAFDRAYSIQQTTDGGYVVAGGSESNDGDVSGNHGFIDCWIVKLDGFGNMLWERSLGGSSNETAHSIQQITDGGYVVAGWSTSNDGDVSGNQGDIDYWIVKYKPHTVGIPTTSFFEHFTVFPNPASGQILLDFELEQIEDLKIEIVDALGMVVYNETLPAVQEFNRNLDLTGFADGVYFVKVQAGVNTYTEKIIVGK